MIANLMALSVRARWTVLALFLVIAGLGVWQLSKLPIDAVPDITTKQVQINTVDPRLSPVEIEKLVTYPVEIALAGIPGLETTRSISRNGFSQVTAIFSESTDLYFARQQVGERLRQATENLPALAMALWVEWDGEDETPTSGGSFESETIETTGIA